MIFTSLAFVVLMAVVLPLYHALPRRPQNVLLLIASYVFYGWWDWRFLFLLFGSTVLDYVVGLMLVAPRYATRRRAILVNCVVVQLALLMAFKYYDFFAVSLHDAMAGLGVEISLPVLNVVLPVGISFYTFHSLSYTIDIYRGQAEPTRDFVAYALFISFFPQLVAGPIARASHLLPQCLRDRRTTGTDWSDGTYLIYWGLFKKVVVADNLGVIVDKAFANPGVLTSGSAVVAIYAFAWQIYCDFSGYTDIARGLSKWFGFDLMINFRVPYLAANPSEFWQRWHISLSSWLRDYLYIPLGGNRGSTLRVYFNLMATMVLGGLWHGASWTFALWGFYQGLLLVIYRLIGTASASQSWFRAIVDRILFFHLVCFGWLLFRAHSLAELTGMLKALARPGLPEFGTAARLGLALPVFLLELLIYKTDDQVAFLKWMPWPVRAVIYVGLYAALVTLGRWNGEGFIYFQF